MGKPQNHVLTELLTTKQSYLATKEEVKFAKITQNSFYQSQTVVPSNCKMKFSHKHALNATDQECKFPLEEVCVLCINGFVNVSNHGRACVSLV